MTVNELPCVVYHGTLSVHKNSLVKGIDISRGYPSTDFGQGFYTTDNYDQAMDIAVGRTKAYFIKNHIEVLPIIVTYSLNLDMLKKCKGRIFEDSEIGLWKEFVYNNRVGLDYSVSSLHNLNHRYGYVYGAVADSNIIDMTREIKNGLIDYGAFADKLKVLKGGLYTQLSFHTNEAANALSIVDIKNVEREELLIL